jgi:hypothetical protein
VALEPGGNVVDDGFDAVRKALRVGEFLAVVDHMNAKADLICHPSKEVPDVTGAENVHVGSRLDRLDKHLHLTATDKARLFSKIVGELIPYVLRLARLDGLPSLPERVIFITAPANRAHGAAVRINEHLGSHPLRRGPRG